MTAQTTVDAEERLMQTMKDTVMDAHGGTQGSPSQHGQEAIDAPRREILPYEQPLKSASFAHLQ